MTSSFSTVATVDCIFQQLNHDLFIAVLLGSWFQTTTGKRKKKSSIKCDQSKKCPVLHLTARMIYGVFFLRLNVFPLIRVDAEIADIGPPADWVKINVRESVSICCFPFS